MNSVTSNYAPDEIVFAKNNKSRNSIIIYKIDSFTFPKDIELLFSSLNQRDAASNSLNVLLDDVLQILAQGKISRIPRVSKNTNIDDLFNVLFNAFQDLDYYSVIHYELEMGLWKENWNHHMLLMKDYKAVGDRRNYGILLNMYNTSGIVYYPQFYGVISQVWDMIEYGYIEEAETHIDYLLKKDDSRLTRICSDINYTNILLLSGKHQQALNRYKDIMQYLNKEERYFYLLKDFDTMRWMGYNQLYNNIFLNICSNLGYNGRFFYTSFEGHLECNNIDSILCSRKWHWREGRTHIIVSYRSFNGIGNCTYNFVEYEINFGGRIFDVLPFGMDESNNIESKAKIFCQYRLTGTNKRLFLEEYDAARDYISSGEIIKLTNSDFHVKILYNGNPNQQGKIRKYKAI